LPTLVAEGTAAVDAQLHRLFLPGRLRPLHPLGDRETGIVKRCRGPSLQPSSPLGS
jgi:hypothetical protein